jgi:hypothetical protein
MSTKIDGYRTLSAVEVALINAHKQMEALVLDQLDDLQQAPEIDGRWLAIARTHLELGFMAMNRAVARPERLPRMEG